VWNSLRNGAKKGADTLKSATAATQILRRFTGADQFTQRDFRAFAGALKDAGIAFQLIDAFVDRYSAYYDANPKAADRPDAKFGHLKFDIHGDIARPVEMARILNELDVRGMFLVMHRHALNESWYGTQKMWDALKEIRGFGHEIGLHADPFHLITTHGDLYAGVEAAIEDFAKQGFAIRAMTLHGDSRPHIKARKLQANDFFADGFRKSKWDGLPPEGQEKLAEHVRRYKHRKLYRKCGIEYVADGNLVRHGALIVDAPIMYLSDNHRCLRIGNIEPRIVQGRVLESPDTFAITPEFTAEAVKVLVRRPFLALFHPQWYR
jgi:hypothetical protein